MVTFFRGRQHMGLTIGPLTLTLLRLPPARWWWRQLWRAEWVGGCLVLVAGPATVTYWLRRGS